MLKIIFTVDYEIHGNGEGSPLKLLVESTSRTLRLFNHYGAKLTIMADVAEILKFREYYVETKYDLFYYNAIVDQLREAIRTGHDVQLHIHSSYCNAIFKNGKWAQDYSEYNLAGLPPDRIHHIIKEGKEYLEKTLQPVNPKYKCIAFRAACWSMNPTRNIANALHELGFKIDTSVFKYGVRNTNLVHFDYSRAESELMPWEFNMDDVCSSSYGSGLFEFPIFSEMRPIWSFVSINRLFRAILSYQHNIYNEHSFINDVDCHNNKYKVLKKCVDIYNLAFKKQPRKMDYNQCSGWQLVDTLKRIEKRYGNDNRDLPIVLIGHSKLFTWYNVFSIKSFLKYAAKNSERLSFGTFGQFDLRSFQ